MRIREADSVLLLFSYSVEEKNRIMKGNVEINSQKLQMGHQENKIETIDIFVCDIIAFQDVYIPFLGEEELFLN